MSVRLAVPASGLRTTAAFALLVITSLVYLGISPLPAGLFTLSWFALGSLGAWVLETFLKTEGTRHRMLVVLGPGPLLGLGITVFIYLIFRGGVIGVTAVIALFVVATATWFKRTQHFLQQTQLPRASMLSFVGVALLANSREFPNLLLPAVGLLILGISVEHGKHRWVKIVGVLVAAPTFFIELITRPAYWWWSSNDTATLAGIGTMIIERGKIGDVAGWSTISHHWLLHAWLALWNDVSVGNILQTYLIIWPLLAALSLFASLWLCLELFSASQVSATVFVTVAACTAGFVQLEWAAPQEQQPFVFAMFACSALWLLKRDRTNNNAGWRLPVGAAISLVVVPPMLYFLKPSLLVAYGLILFATIMVHLGWSKGYQLTVGIAASVVVIVCGIAALSLASSRISRNSFASISVSFMSRDLGWCKTESVVYSTLCVLSLQSLLMVSVAVSTLFLWSKRGTSKFVISTFVFVPLALAYLPLRFLISSSVGSGSPSFFRLSEIGLMLFTSLVLAFAIREYSSRILLTLVPLTYGIVAAGWSPGSAYDAVARGLVSVTFLKYLNASDAIAVILAVIVAMLFYAAAIRGRKPTHFVAVLLSVVCLFPVARTTSVSLLSTTDPIRTSRPTDFGPSDIEEVANWVRENTAEDTRLATNYLCPTDRLGECSGSDSASRCPSREPLLWSSWMLVAFSKRDFVYLSQWWDNKNHFFEHELSTGLGKNPTSDTLRQLEEADVSYYLASRVHSSSGAWQLFREVAVFETKNFVVVPLAALRERVAS